MTVRDWTIRKSLISLKVLELKNEIRDLKELEPTPTNKIQELELQLELLKVEYVNLPNDIRVE